MTDIKSAMLSIMPKESWKALQTILHHHIGHMEYSPLTDEKCPLRAVERLDENIRCYIDDNEISCDKLKQTEALNAEKILTEPDLLAKYTCEFFGTNGPYPLQKPTL